MTGTSSQSGVLSSDTYAALLQAAQNGGANASQSSQSPSAALKDLFSLLDNDGNGQISKAEFEADLGAGGTNIAAADSVFAKLDTNGDGSVSQSELASALQGAGHRGGHHHMHSGGAAGAGGAQGGGDADGGAGGSGSAGSSKGATTTSTTNADGSVTTTISYADGSKVSTTTAATASASSNAASSYNFIEKMIQRQAKALSASATQGVSVNA